MRLISTGKHVLTPNSDQIPHPTPRQSVTLFCNQLFIDLNINNTETKHKH